MGLRGEEYVFQKEELREGFYIAKWSEVRQLPVSSGHQNINNTSINKLQKAHVFLIILFF